jgi:hypothetical protein
LKPVDPSETLSRFVVYNRWIRADNTVRHIAFTPNKNGATSVFRISGISDNEVWNIGEREVGTKQNKPILGRADITASIISNHLEIIPSEPPERHADITGWPEEKDKQKDIALELAEAADLYKK